MKIKNINCYLVHPSKHEKIKLPITETQLISSSAVFKKIEAIFHEADNNCNTEIVFNHDQNGKQKNIFKEMIKNYSHEQNSTNGKPIAISLQDVTNKQSGLGLLFLSYGEDGEKKKLVISRFAADEGISAKESGNNLNLQFVDKVFLKKSNLYKSAVFSGHGNLNGMTSGWAVDKQGGSEKDAPARYWINDFLQCSLKTTPAEGTIRLAKKIQEALKATSDIERKEEIISGARLLKNMDGKRLSGEQFCKKFHLSESSSELIRSVFKYDQIFKEEFELDILEFQSIIAFRSLELDSGVVITANAYLFDDKVKIKDAENGNVYISTNGKIVDDKLTKAKR